MRDTELTAPTSTPESSPVGGLPSVYAMVERAAAAAGLRRECFIDDARRAETPHIVLTNGLTRTDLPVGVFEPELHKRVNWCRQRAADWERSGGRWRRQPRGIEYFGVSDSHRFREQSHCTRGQCRHGLSLVVAPPLGHRRSIRLPVWVSQRERLDLLAAS